MSVTKIRIHAIAKELGRTSKEVLEKAQKFGLPVKSVSSAITTEEAAQLAEYIHQEFTNKSVSKPEMPDKPISDNGGASKQEIKPSVDPIQDTQRTKQKIRVNQDFKKEEQQKSIASRTPPPQNKDTTSLAQEQPITPQSGDDSKVSGVKLGVAQEKESPATDAVLPGRKLGLRIVKKKNEEKRVSEQVQKDSVAPKSIHDLLRGSADDQMQTKKKRPERKKAATSSHKKKEQKLDLLSNRDFSHFGGYDEDEEELFLFDLSVRDDLFEDKEQEFERSQKPKKETQQRNAHHKNNRDRDKEGREQKITHRPPPQPPKPKDDTIKVSEGIRAYEFADKIDCSLSSVIKVLFNLGMMVTKNDFLDKDSIEILAEELGVKVLVEDDSEALGYIQEEEQEDVATLITRPPVVTIMGHVDHGKTSLLDKIRNTKVAAGESGGITQHIGAYTISKDGQMISFIDTPGHEAFTEMRARGAGVTDIVIIVIAADDGIKQQTIEALDHAKAANVPIIIAVNKIDKPDANTDRVKSEAAELGYTPVEWGGEHEFIHISAKTGEGIDTLLETILIQAEILELKANPDTKARAVVIESSLEKGKGPVATVIVKNGTLNIGESIVADMAYGRVRALIDDTGKSIKSIGPSEVAVVTGLSEVPVAGAILMAVANDSIAREYAEKRASYLRQKEFSRSTKVSLDELSSMVAEGQLKSLPVIIKTDTQGSLEAIRGSLEKIRNDEVKVHIIHSGVGGITESDIVLAQTSTHSVILGFNVRPTGNVKSRAKEVGVEIKTYSIIYDLVNEIKGVLSGMMSPVIEEESTGQAEVREVFRVPKIGSVAGCFVSDGVIQKGIKARVIRDGVVIYSSTISSLKRFKDDAREVTKGFECGIMIDGFNDIAIHDVIETYKEIEKNKTL